MAIVKFVKRFLPESYDLKRYAQDVYEEFFYLINVLGVGDGGPGLSNQTPKPVASAGAAGSGEQGSKWDHEHKGTSSWGIDGGTLFYGAAAVKEGTNITLSGAAGVVTINTTIAGFDLSNEDPQPTANAGTSGTGPKASRDDHVHAFHVTGTGGELIVNVAGDWTLFTGSGGELVYNNGSGWAALSAPGAGDFILHNINDVLTWV